MLLAMESIRMLFKPSNIRYLVIERLGGSFQGYAFSVPDTETINVLVKRLRTIYRAETSTAARLFLQIVLLRRTTVEIAKITSVCRTSLLYHHALIEA